MTNKIPWIAAGIFFIWAVVATMCSNPEPADNSIYHREINSQNVQIKTLEAHNRALLDSIKADSLKDVKEKEAFTARLNALKKKTTIVRTVVMQQVDTLPQVKAFIADQDSIIMLQSVRIQGLEFTNAKMELNTMALRANFDEIMKLERQKFALAEQQISDLEKQNRKERRKKKLSQVLIPVAGAVMFLLGSQL